VTRRPTARLIPAQTATAAPPTAASATLATFVDTQARQALQQTAAIGACSPYFEVAWTTRLCQIVFTSAA
jgi:hypothetical protein